MKILHIVHQYAPDFVGGTELYTAKVAAEQVALGHEVAIYVPTPRQPENGAVRLEKSIEGGIEVYRAMVGPRSAGKIFAETFYGSSVVSGSFAQLLQVFRPDVAHVQHLMGVNLNVIHVLRLARVPYVVTLHDYWYGCANAQLLTNYDGTVCAGPNRLFTNCGRCALARSGRPDRLGAVLGPLFAYRQRLLRTVLAGAKQVIAPTLWVKRIYEEMGFKTDNFVHIPHGIALPETLIAEARTAAPALRQAQDARFVVAYVGGISEQKGLHTLIAAFNGLPADATLTIYGDLSKFPDYADLLRREIDHRGIQLAGRLPHDQIWQVMATADVVAMPTHWYEASPLTIDEVFAAGSPLLASDLGAMTEKIRHGVDGWLVPAGDVAAWGAALQMFYEDGGLSGRLREEIRPVVTLGEHVAQVMRVYATD